MDDLAFSEEDIARFPKVAEYLRNPADLNSFSRKMKEMALRDFLYRDSRDFSEEILRIQQNIGGF